LTPVDDNNFSKQIFISLKKKIGFSCVSLKKKLYGRVISGLPQFKFKSYFQQRTEQNSCHTISFISNSVGIVKIKLMAWPTSLNLIIDF
jgi:hypothetical protein